MNVDRSLADRSPANRLPRQAATFGAVGIAATATHFLTASALFSFAALPIVMANIIGFAVAFLVSFFGHHHLSFRSTASRARSFWRFAAVASIGFIINNFVLEVLRATQTLGDRSALAVAIAAAAAAVFVLSRFWAFASGPPKA